jgi:HAD superfamily hydrolase (TIGR01549 family)
MEEIPLNTFIFDLDGTLLPMPSQELFLDAYFKALSMKFIPYGYDTKELVKAVWLGTKAMIENDGSMTNEQRFWDIFCAYMGEEARQLEDLFDDFYRNEFHMAKSTTGVHPLAKECINLLKQKGYQVALATNPLFPQVATFTRIAWAGLSPNDFSFITTYENSSFCKPNPAYYKDVLEALGKEPQDCIMVGNDVKEDMCAASLGMDTYLLNDCIICPEGEDISGYRMGSFEELYEYIRQLPHAE